MTDTPSIQWFPGHMTKTRRMMEKNLKLVDLVLEIVDARIPASSRNPELDKWLGKKPRMILLNKMDAADPNMTDRWIRYYQKRGIAVFACDCRTGRNLQKFLPTLREELAPLIERRNSRGMTGRALRVMVVGIPNVGKSSFINKMAGSKRAKVEDRPGVTREKQWVNIGTDLELLDMPGVLWPKFEDQQVAERLAFTGAVKDDVIDIELLAMRLLGYLREQYPQMLTDRYKVTPDEWEMLDDYDLLTLIGRKRGMLISGGEINTERAAITILDEFRGGKLGRITLEAPPEDRK